MGRYCFRGCCRRLSSATRLSGDRQLFERRPNVRRHAIQWEQQMPTHIIPLQPGAPITWLMVHTKGGVNPNEGQGRCIALTVDSPSMDKLTEAMSPAINLFEGKKLSYITDSSDAQTHQWLHAEMMTPMGQNLAGT